MGRRKILYILISLCLNLSILSGCNFEESSYGTANVSPLVEQWRRYVEDYASMYGVSDHVELLMAMIAQESGGDSAKTPDIMQCSASAGLSNNSITDPIASIRQGVKYFSELLKTGEQAGVDLDTVLQSYNFGGGYINYVVKNYSGTHDETAARAFSGFMCSRYGYSSYGDVLYVQHVRSHMKQAAQSGITNYALLEAAMHEYEGVPYVFGGTGKSGIDCSALMQKCYLAIGVSLPRTAQEQYDSVSHISENEARPGDLIFFTGTYNANSYITHVGIYVGSGRMYHASSSSGCTYASCETSYWKSHFAGYGRVN